MPTDTLTVTYVPTYTQLREEVIVEQAVTLKKLAKMDDIR
jgi:hypothetical protein